MVATRRGVRVNSPTKNVPEQHSDVQATPSTGRRTRNAAKPVETPSQHSAVETCGQPDNREGRSLVCASGSSIKRCTRASRLHSPEQPSTPVSSTHDVDTSDMESCCSAVSDIELPVTRARGRRQQPRAGTGEDEEISEVESCSSAVSAPKPVHSSRRSTRKKTVPESCGTAHAEAGSANPTQKTESCSSMASESKRVTRSQRKTRSAAKQQTEDSELSDVDSCTSGVSGRAFRRKICPIPMHIDELSEGSQSPGRTTRRTRAARGTAAASLDVSEPPSCDSEGFESGPTYSLSTRTRSRTRSTGPKATDSESEVTDVHSPVGSMYSTRSRGTPCSSRAGSRTSSRSAPATRLSAKDSTVMESAEEGSLNDSKLETTVTESDADCTLLEDKMQTSEGQEVTTDTKKVEEEITDISDNNSQVAPTVSVCGEVLSKHAIVVSHQQEEPSAENNDGDTSENEMTQETILSSLEPCQSVKVTICERASEGTEGADEGQEDVDTQLSLADKSVDEDLKTQPSVEDKMEVIALKTDAQQVVDTSEAHAEPIQVTLSQKHKVTVDFPSEEQPKDVLVQNTKVISLLDSSDDDEFDDEGEQEVSKEEDLGHSEEEREETSERSEAAASSVDGLFMIDTRPGQEAEIHYYRDAQEEEEEAQNKRAEQEEEDEEFVDEEGEEDDEDEDAKVLFSSRSDQLKELSSRIDPGIRVKELGGLYISFDGSKSKPVSSSLRKLKEKKIQDEVMKKSVIGADFEKKDAVPPYSESKHALKLKRRAEREKSTGDGWFNMKAPEMTEELKGDLQVLKMRGSLDPKRFYKKNDRDGFPKYFQVGTVVDSPVDFYHSRIPKKERKRTMVEELLADADFRQQNKKRFQHIMTEKAAQRAGKKNMKKKQFHKKSN